jgi:cupin fold WbuC family metalloprotein
MIPFIEINEEVLYTKESVNKISKADMDFLKDRSYTNKRKRIRLCTHENFDDSVHEMFIVHHSGNYVPPHRHSSKVESYHVIEGELEIIVFSDDGVILDIVRLDHESQEGYFYFRIPKGLYHTVLAVSDTVVFHEITNGPFIQDSINMTEPIWAASEDADADTIYRYLASLEHKKSLFKLAEKKISSMSFLVIGADGTIGGSIKKELQGIGSDFFETTRQVDTVEGNRLGLDLMNAVKSWKIPKGLQVSFFCAGVVKISDCEEAPEVTHKVNVENTLTLIRRLLDAGSTVVYFSSVLVSDIKIKSSGQEDQQTNEYGHQKGEVEKILLGWNEDVIILRMTKVLFPEMPLIKEWITSLKNGIAIHPFSNITMAPISINYLLDTLFIILESGSRGVFELSGDSDISYADAAVFIAKKLRVDGGLVQPILSEKKILKKIISDSPDKNADRLKLEFGIEKASVLGSISDSFSLW